MPGLWHLGAALRQHLPDRLDDQVRAVDVYGMAAAHSYDVDVVHGQGGQLTLEIEPQRLDLLDGKIGRRTDGLQLGPEASLVIFSSEI